MRKRNRFKPYIRKINGKEMPTSMRDAIRLCVFTELSGYVMVQRGRPNVVVAVGRTKRDIKRSILAISLGGMSFKQWSSKVVGKM
jgi:hypothetical protein